MILEGPLTLVTTNGVTLKGTYLGYDEYYGLWTFVSIYGCKNQYYLPDFSHVIFEREHEYVKSVQTGENGWSNFVDKCHKCGHVRQ